VHGILNLDQPLVPFSSAGGSVMVTLPMGTPVTLTNFTLHGDSFEVKSSGQRGFVPVTSVTIEGAMFLNGPVWRLEQIQLRWPG
jgi:hypothetical protein